MGVLAAAVLAVVAGSGAVAGLTSTAAAAATATTATAASTPAAAATTTPTTAALHLAAAIERSGSETLEVFTVTVTGRSGDGFPRGAVVVKTTGGTTLCTRTSATAHGADTSTFACSPRPAALPTGSYTVEATFTPATQSSSTAAVSYEGSTSNSEMFSVTAKATRIYGATTDATAAAELESVYPGAHGDCPGTTSSRPVVLATDEHYPDALAASYLSKWLGTGMLLTPASSLSGATTTALRVEGITNVYVVGGPLAVSTAVVSQVEALSVYKCGGTASTTAHVAVERISGATQYTTAEDIAETPGASFVGSVDLEGAYGLYNDTSGRSSTVPLQGMHRTAVLASGAEFQDAEAAATLAYADDFPLLLTTPTKLSAQALSAIDTLGITQVILMGGPLAVSNSVVTVLVDHDVSVLRVAGVDYTDTAVELAHLELGSTAGHVGLGWSPTGGVTVARGDFFTDGLAGAVVSAHGGSTDRGPQPMLLTESPTSVGSYLTAFLEVAGTEGVDDDAVVVTSLTVLGGPLAVSTTIVTAMEDDL